MKLYDVEQTIKKAGKEQKTLSMLYARSSKPGPREIEPYEIRDKDLFGYDIDKQEIRRFKMDQIQSIEETQNDFDPRWDIKVE